MLMACNLKFFFCEIPLFGNSVIRCTTYHNEPISFIPLYNEVAIYLGLLDSIRDSNWRIINNINPLITFLYVPLISTALKYCKLGFEKRQPIVPWSWPKKGNLVGGESISVATSL